EDLVGVEAVEGAMANEGVVPLTADGPVVAPVRERPAQPLGVGRDRGPGRRDGLLQTGRLGRRQDAGPGRDELGEQAGQAVRLLDLELLPAADLRNGRPALRRLEIARDALQPAGDGIEALGEWRVVPGEQQEERIADRVEREGAAL